MREKHMREKQMREKKMREKKMQKNAALLGGIFATTCKIARYCVSGITRISTRRFLARPASVLLSAIG